MSSLGALAVFMAGYSSNNKYALFGSMRVIAMLVSYEIPIVLSLLGIVLFTGTMNAEGIVLFQEHYWSLMIMLQPLAFIIYFFSVSAELNRTPADIAEAESEIVGGYHTEYSGMKFGLFYAAELINAVAVSAIISTLFLGGWWVYKLDEIVPGWMIYIGKIYAVYFLFVWTRGTLPRFRIDQLLAFAWKWLTPMAILNIVMVAAEVTIWEETGVSAGIILPIYMVVNTAFAGGSHLRLRATARAELRAVPDDSCASTRTSTCRHCPPSRRCAEGDDVIADNGIVDRVLGAGRHDDRLRADGRGRARTDPGRPLPGADVRRHCRHLHRALRRLRRRRRRC